MRRPCLPGEKAATYTENPSHASDIAARVGRAVTVSSVEGGGGGGGGGALLRPKSIVGDDARARGRKTASFGRIVAASRPRGGGVCPGAGTSLAKTMRPASSTWLKVMPRGPSSPFTTTN